MKRYRNSFLVLLLIASASLLAGCGGSGGGGVGGFVTTDPTWVSASWTGGALGPPNDRMDVEATDWQGLICPASHLVLDYNGATLNFQNHCNIPVSYAICHTAGSLEGAPECAPDPFDTPTSRLRFVTLNPGNLGDYLNASGSLFVNFFYCSDEASLLGGPVRCLQVP